MKPIEFHPGASQDAHDARDFYESKRLGLVDEFANELESSLRRIGENPKLYVCPETRCESLHCIDSRTLFITGNFLTEFGSLRLVTIGGVRDIGKIAGRTECYAPSSRTQTRIHLTIVRRCRAAAVAACGVCSYTRP